MARKQEEFKTPQENIDAILPTRYRLKCKNHVQKDLARLITEKEIIIAAGPAGVGKAQPLYSKLLTPNGWITMGDINIGDYVIGSNGKPTKVTGVFPQGKKNIYRVYFSDGSYTDCCDEHLWLTQTYYDRNYKVKEDGIRKYKPRKGSVKTLSEIMETLYTNRGDKNHTIPIVSEVEFTKREFFVDPYLMGCLLGDGCLKQNRIVFTTNDDEILETIENRLNAGHRINKLSSKYSHSIVGENNKNQIFDELINLNLKNIDTIDKFIPDVYKFNEPNVRLEILQGLMDTDGYVNKKGTSVFFTNTSKKLIDDIGFIVNSLGGIYNISEKIGSYRNSNGNIITCHKAYTLTISLPPHINPFKLSSKRNLVKGKSKYRPKRYITSVEPIGEFEAQCISVDSEDQLYVTDNFIVTHNTYVSVARAIELLQNKTSPYTRIIISTPAEEAGENLGYLPGNLREKMEPYLASTLDVFDKIIGKKKRLELEELEIIQIQPLGFIRGKSIDNTILIMEEAQNMTKMQMKTLLTRIGNNSKFIISGDLDQSDRFKNPEHSGLHDAIRLHNNLSTGGILIIDDKEEHFVRNPIIKEILDNYKNDVKIVEVDDFKVIRTEPIMIREDFSKPKKKVTKNKILTWFRKKFKW